jgi:hypothetical protein
MCRGKIRVVMRCFDADPGTGKGWEGMGAQSFQSEEGIGCRGLQNNQRTMKRAAFIRQRPGGCAVPYWARRIAGIRRPRRPKWRRSFPAAPVQVDWTHWLRTPQPRTLKNLVKFKHFISNKCIRLLHPESGSGCLLGGSNDDQAATSRTLTTTLVYYSHCFSCFPTAWRVD